MTHGWLRLGLLAATLLALRLVIYAAFTGHVAQLPADLCQWDCRWYVHTAVQGYDPAQTAQSPLNGGQANWAFLPLYPLLMHIFSSPWLSPVQAGFIISNLCFLGFMLLGYGYLRLIHAAPAPLLFFGFFISFPYGIYFSFTYTESLYALLTMGAFTALARQRFYRAGLFTALLSATRVTGIVMAPIMALHMLWVNWPLIRQKRWREAAKPLPALLISPLGLALFMAYLYLHTGDALAFLHIEAKWQRTPGNPFTQLLAGLAAAFYPGLIPAVRYDSMFLACCDIAGLLLSIWIAKRGHLGEAAFLAMTVLLAASTGLVSMQRYVFASPVFMLFLFVLLSTGWRRRALPYLIALGAALQLYFLHLWLQGSALLV